MLGHFQGEVYILNQNLKKYISQEIIGIGRAEAAASCVRPAIHNNKKKRTRTDLLLLEVRFTVSETPRHL